MVNAHLKRWFPVVGFAAALVFTGDHLALSRSSPERLRFAHTFTADSERTIVNAAIAEFEQEHPPVKIEQVVFNSETYQTIGWRLQFHGRQQPDVFFHWRGFKVNYAVERGWAMDMTPYLSPGFLDQLLPSTVQRIKGGIYLLPQSVDISNLVWYNQDVFARLGLAEPATLEQWREVCLRLRAAKLLPLAQGNRDLWPMGNFGEELLGQSLGAARLDRLFQSGTVVEPTDLRGLGTLEFFRTNGCLDLPGVLEPGGIGAMSDIDAKVVFLTGKSAQHIVGSWFLADIADARAKNELRFPVGLFPAPSGVGELDAMTSVTTGFLVNPATKNPRAATAFIELLLSRKYQSQFAALGNLSARKDAASFTSEPLGQRMLEILAKTPVIVPPPDTGYLPEHANIFYEVCGKILTGKLTVASAAEYWNDQKRNLARKGL